MSVSPELQKKTSNPEIKKKLLEIAPEFESREKLARSFGYTGGALSQYLHDKYPGSIENFENAVREFLKNREAAAELKSSVISNDYKETSISTLFYGIIQVCHLQGGLAIGCGDAGIGKTMACLHYIENNPNSSYLVTANACFSNPSAFLGKICDCLNIKLAKRRLSDMWNALASAFSGGKKVLIIDEAQFLTVRIVEILRSLSDENPNFGICLIGNTDINNNIYNARDQIRNRTKMNKTYHTNDIDSNDIKLIFPAIKDDEERVKLMLSVARSVHGLRGAVNVFNNAINSDDISHKGLLQHIKELPKKVF